jgi:hypothetical protein
LESDEEKEVQNVLKELFDKDSKKLDKVKVVKTELEIKVKFSNKK